MTAGELHPNPHGDASPALGRFGRKAFLVGATLGTVGLGMVADRGPQAFGQPGGGSSASGGPILADERFPIGLFWPPPPFETTTQRYQQIVDAGFTFVITGNYQDDAQILDYLLGITDTVGLQVLVATDPNLVAYTHDFTINDAGGAFTLTSAEATTALRRAISQYAGSWQIVNGALVINGGSSSGSVGLTKQGADWSDYTFSFDLTLENTDPSIGYAQGGWAFRAQDAGNAYEWLLSDHHKGAPAAPGYLTKATFVNGKPVTVDVVPLAMTITPGTTYHVATSVSGSTITTSVDGTVIDTTTDARYAKGRVGFREAGRESASYDNVVVTGSGGAKLFADDFSGSLGAWDTPDGHPSFAGLSLYDEPSGAKVADIGRWISLMTGLGEPYLAYTNLSSRHGSAYTAQAKTLGAPILSFDRYPILKGNVADPGYFQNWADVRAAAMANDIPSWTYIQSVSFNGQGVPTKADLLWQINVSLAYGCQGIQYFTYWTPDPARGQAFHGGLIDVEGTKTQLYTASQEVNRDWLAPVGRQLLGKPSQAVHALNLSAPPAGLPTLPDDDPVVARAHGSAAYVGRFGSGSDDDPRQWLLVGNYSNASTATVELIMTNAVTKVEEFDPRTASYADSGRGAHPHRYTLQRGAAVLLRVS